MRSPILTCILSAQCDPQPGTVALLVGLLLPAAPPLLLGAVAMPRLQVGSSPL